MMTMLMSWCVLLSPGEWKSLLSFFPFDSVRFTSVVLISGGPRQVD